jgi:hypothetical protein
MYDEYRRYSDYKRPKEMEINDMTATLSMNLKFESHSFCWKSSDSKFGIATRLRAGGSGF